MMLHHEFPHVPSCPLLPVIASYFLLFMEDRDCHACMSAILESIDDNYLDCSQKNYAATLRTFQDLTKVLLVSYNIIIKVHTSNLSFKEHQYLVYLHFGHLLSFIS